METNLKKALSIFGVVCFSMMTNLFAGPYDSDHDDMDHQHHRAAVPPGAQHGEDGPICFFTADYTFWAVRQSGLAYVVSNDYTQANPPAQASRVRGQVFYPNWKARSGFKVGAGCYLNHDGWDLYVEYTWFYNKQQKDRYQNPANFTVNQGFGTYWIDASGVIATSEIYQSQVFWANFFNRIDAQLARAFYAGHYLQLRPFAGLLGAWDDQWYNIQYKITNTPGWDTWQNKQSWWGIGPYAGCSSAFMFPLGDNSTQWSLFMDMGTALPWGKYQTDKKLDDGTTGTISTDAWTRNTYWTTDVMLEMALGLRWETWMTEGMNWNFMIQAAWEEQVYFNHGYFSPIGFEAVSANGNYIMQGLTLKLKVGF